MSDSKKSEDIWPSQFVRMFQPRFAALVESGLKRQTVRKIPKRLMGAGDYLSCREWTGKPYRSKQRVLCEAVVKSVQLIQISRSRCLVTDVYSGPITQSVPIGPFAHADGFKDWDELVAWFEDTHSLPFTGILIKWQPDPLDKAKDPMLFSQRKKLSDEARRWCEEKHISPCPFNLVTALESMGKLNHSECK